MSTLSKHPLFWIGIIIFLSALLRIPFLSHPDTIVFDEGVYKNFALADIHQRPYLDIHPPLAKALFAQFAAPSTPEIVTHELTEKHRVFVRQPFGPFDRVSARAFVSFFGVLLPLVLFLFARSLGISLWTSGCIGLIAVFDNALILYSRLVLPDTLMLVFGFFGLTLISLSENAKRPSHQVAWLLAGVLFLSGALLIKWTACAFLFVAALLLCKKSWSALCKITSVIVLSLLLYITVFLLYFSYFFPHGGQVKNILLIVPLEVPNTLIAPPEHATLFAKGDFLLRYHQSMLSSNSLPAVLLLDLNTQGPLVWASGATMLGFWTDGTYENKRIILMGNIALWLPFVISWLTYLFYAVRKKIANTKETSLVMFLSLAYLANYIPFFFIDRPMFLYHYFPALLFMILLASITLPFTFTKIITCLRAEKYRTLIIASYVSIVCATFAITAIITYGL